MGAAIDAHRERPYRRVAAHPQAAIAGSVFQVGVQCIGPARALTTKIQHPVAGRLDFPRTRLGADLTSTANHQSSLDMPTHGRKRIGADQQQRANTQQQ
ncbi:hypothetical protein D3C78_1752170 [compost metagenome]